MCIMYKGKHPSEDIYFTFKKGVSSVSTFVTVKIKLFFKLHVLYFNNQKRKHMSYPFIV